MDQHRCTYSSKSVEPFSEAGFWSSLWQQIPAGMLFGVMIEILLCVIPTYWLFGYKRNKKRLVTEKSLML